jgi:hypothetical protein
MSLRRCSQAKGHSLANRILVLKATGLRPKCAVPGRALPLESARIQTRVDDNVSDPSLNEPENRYVPTSSQETPRAPTAHHPHWLVPGEKGDFRPTLPD